MSLGDEKSLCTARYPCEINEHRRNWGNIADPEPLGDTYKARGRQGLSCFGKSILCILVHWDGPGVYVCLQELSKAHPDPPRAIQALGRGECGLSVALPSASQLEVHILLAFWGGSCAWGRAFFLQD